MLTRSLTRRSVCFVACQVHVYRGIKHDRFVPPAELADNDIIVTTYEVLRAEVHFTTAKSDRPRRSDQK
jgi:hypothetical protein